MLGLNRLRIEMTHDSNYKKRILQEDNIFPCVYGRLWLCCLLDGAVSWLSRKKKTSTLAASKPTHYLCKVDAKSRRKMATP